jgi:hypothetical protein
MNAIDRLYSAILSCYFISNHCMVPAHGPLTVMRKPLGLPAAAFSLGVLHWIEWSYGHTLRMRSEAADRRHRERGRHVKDLRVS